MSRHSEIFSENCPFFGNLTNYALIILIFRLSDDTYLYYIIMGCKKQEFFIVADLENEHGFNT